MAIYDLGTASLAANGEVTGVGTTWKAPLTLIRVGATIVFKTEPVQIYTISEIISDTQVNVYNPNSETVPAGTGYAILAHDGITVQGLAQDVAETLRYYQSKETSIESLLQFIGQGTFDWPRFEQLASQSTTGAAEALASQIAAAESASTAESARDTATAARDATIEAINSAGDAGTLVTLAGWGIGPQTSRVLSQLDFQTFDFVIGGSYRVVYSGVTNLPSGLIVPSNATLIISVEGGNAETRTMQVTTYTATTDNFRRYNVSYYYNGSVRYYYVREAIYLPGGNEVGGANAQRVRGLLDVYSKGEIASENSQVPIAGVTASKVASNTIATEYLEAPDVYDVFVTYGQSNSAGEAILSGDTSGFPSPSPKSMMYDFTDNSIKPIIQGIVSSTGVASSGHAWGEFENEWYRLSGRGSVSVHCGRGAQTITALSKGGTYYTALLSAVTSAKAAMVSGGYTIGDVYVLFHQGETDMSGGTTYNAYRDKMITLIDDLSVDVGMKLFGNFTVGCPLNRTEESWARIQNAQRWVCNSKENAVTLFDGCGSFAYGDGNVGTDGVHYTQKGYNLMGREGAKGLWSIVNKGQTTKTSSDLLQYSNFVAPWSRTRLASGTLGYSASKNSWVILSKDNTGDSPWRLSNLHKPVPEEAGGYISIEVADNAANWFSLNATVNKEMGREGVRVFAEPATVGNAFTVRLAFYADISLVVNTSTGDLRYNRPLSPSLRSWISKNISVEVTSKGNIQLVHGRTNSIPSVSKYTIRTDGGIDEGDVAFRIVDNQRTRIISTGTSNNWVAVCLRDVLLSPSNLTESGITVNINGFYAPSL